MYQIHIHHALALHNCLDDSCWGGGLLKCVRGGSESTIKKASLPGLRPLKPEESAGEKDMVITGSARERA